MCPLRNAQARFDALADSICRTMARLPRFSAPILPDGMQHSHLLPSSSGSPLPERFLSRLAGFADLFTRPTWSNVLVLLAGVILAPGRRTVTAALRILGRDRDPEPLIEDRP